MRTFYTFMVKRENAMYVDVHTIRWSLFLYHSVTNSFLVESRTYFVRSICLTNALHVCFSGPFYFGRLNAFVLALDNLMRDLSLEIKTNVQEIDKSYPCLIASQYNQGS